MYYCGNTKVEWPLHKGVSGDVFGGSLLQTGSMLHHVRALAILIHPTAPLIDFSTVI